MSIFKENVWECDETGDKLAKDLFSKNKKIKAVKTKSVENTKQNGKKMKENRKNKSKDVSSRSEDKGVSSNERSLDQNKRKNSNNKRKAAEITIDENIIKKWKSESTINQGEKFGKRTTKLADQSSQNKAKNKLSKSKIVAKERNSEAGEKPDKVAKKKKLNGTQNENKKIQGENDSNDSNVMTKSQKRRLKHKQKLLNGQNDSQGEETPSILNGQKNVNSTNLGASDNVNKSASKIDRIKKLLMDKEERRSKRNENLNEPKSLRDRMLARLKSSRFRYLNEQMYNSESWSSKKYFKDDPDAFLAYHEGYKLQVDQWPLNPLDTIIASIKKLPKDYVVADFGCGEARLAESVSQNVHSLDLVAVNDNVTACDMAHTNLLTSRIDVVVFCLSLMGTNLTDYLVEANRVLRKDGILKIAEVESRFEDVDEFVKMLASYGFVNTWKDLSHDLFYFMDFKKDGDITKKKNKLPSVTLKSCLYKRR